MADARTPLSYRNKKTLATYWNLMPGLEDNKREAAAREMLDAQRRREAAAVAQQKPAPQPGGTR